MPTEDRWLSLVISKNDDNRPGVLIQIPKKAVPLAVHRNRLKRLIREAVRGDDFFRDPGKCFAFRARGFPDDAGLGPVKQMISELKKETAQPR